MQEQLWFLNQLEPNSDAYNVPTAIRFKGRLDLKALQQAFDKIVQRHEALRVTFHFSDGNLRQAVGNSMEVKIAVTNLSDGSEARLLEVLQEEARRPFDLERGPLIRARLVRMNELDHALVAVMHHAVTDGWSLDILFRELEENYRALASGGAAPLLPALPIQFADYAQWQRSWMQGEVREKELTYWKEKLAGAPPQVDLPTDSADPKQSLTKAARSVIELPGQIRNEIVNLAKAEGAPLLWF